MNFKSPVNKELNKKFEEQYLEILYENLDDAYIRDNEWEVLEITLKINETLDELENIS